MSFPRKLHVLVIEDEQDPIDGYRQLLKSFRAEFPSVDPAVARSFADAKALLDGEHIYHLIILDLNLPLATKGQPPEGLDPGQQLLEMAARREAYPIPAMLVISGKLGMAQLSDLRRRLQTDFWYGEMVNKGDPRMADELKSALGKCQEYCDVGIHLRDGGRDWFPTLSPREEDLLRRCILGQQNCLGVDLEWWGAEAGPSLSQPSPDAGPTKVLMGRFLLDEGLEHSRPTFFKFEPTGNSEYVCRDVGILDQKLSHVKVKHAEQSRSRCLLVTQSVTNSRPVPLDNYLQEDPASVQPYLPQLIADVEEQLGQLGRCTEDQAPFKSLLWRYHNRGALQQAWERADLRGLFKAGAQSPLPVFDQLAGNGDLTWVTRRSCTHGDLNATNVAVDSSPADRPRAYIFDAAGVHADVAMRDFAVLEVTTLLFLDAPDFERHFGEFSAFYRDTITSVPSELADRPPVVCNTACLLTAIRGVVANQPNPQLYPILVFDAAMIQLGSLAVQPSRNKIVNPIRACYLASWAASWLMAGSIHPTPLDAVDRSSQQS